MKDAELLEAIEGRVRRTICETFNSSGQMTIEGSILKDDFESLLRLLGDIRKAERERCARLHEDINPASDDERHHRVPGAGAMGAVIEYRDQIRALQ